MTRKFYAGESYYGIKTTYDSGGWTVHVFSSKAGRDEWVKADPSQAEPHREAITSKVADRIAPVAGYGTEDYRHYHD